MKIMRGINCYKRNWCKGTWLFKKIYSYSLQILSILKNDSQNSRIINFFLVLKSYKFCRQHFFVHQISEKTCNILCETECVCVCVDIFLKLIFFKHYKNVKYR